MKKIYIIAALVLVLAVFAAGAVFFAQGRAAIFIKEKGLEGLSNIINTKAEVGDVKVNLFRGIVYFSNLKVKNPAGFSETWFVSIPSGFIDVSLESLLFKRIEIDRIFLREPKFNIEIKEDGISNTRMIFKKSTSRENDPSQAVPARKQETYFRIRKIEIKKGVYQFVNYKVNAMGARIMFNEIDVDITNLTKPRKPGEMPTLVKCEGLLPFSRSGGRIKLEGRGGFLTELIDFDAKLQATNIFLPAFMPFYANTSPILAVTGNFDLTAEGRCRENGLYSIQQVNLTDLEVAVNANAPSDNVVFGLPIQTVMQFFINSRGDLDFSFEITGTLSDPQFHLAEAFKKVLAQSIGNAIMKGVARIPNMVMERVKETGNIEDAGKKVLQDVFKQILGQKQEGENDQQPQDSGDLQTNR